MIRIASALSHCLQLRRCAASHAHGNRLQPIGYQVPRRGASGATATNVANFDLISVNRMLGS